MVSDLPWPISNFAQLLPTWQAVGFFGATFILEDAAAVGAGLLLAGGVVTWPVAFLPCFLGIWTGDAGLYALARFGGRPWFERSRWRRFREKVNACEKWFANHGKKALIFSRMIPGARLPTYLAAGFLRVPLPGFLLITGIAAFCWTLVVLMAVRAAGASVLEWLGEYKMDAWFLIGAIVLAWLGIRLVRRSLPTFQRNRWWLSCERLRRWEFWPMWMFYPPVALYCLWLALKYRGLNVATASNPGIFAGGLVGESKMETLNQLRVTSPEFTADAELIRGDTFEARLESLWSLSERFGYPFILKPDLGQRGLGVKIIRDGEQAKAYLRLVTAPIVAQRYVAGPLEAGIFYYRFPDETTGHIFAITEKIFPVVIGDGHSTILDLIQKDPRARLISGKYLTRLQGRAAEVLAHGETLKLVEAGNHAQGCIFRDGSRLASPQLLERIDSISRKLGGFHIGRYDVRYSSDDDLRAGRNFQIIELNGAAAEATSIYDAKNSLLSAYRTLFRQWELVFAIGAANRRCGCSPTKTSVVLNGLLAFRKFAKTYPVAD